MTSHNFTVKTDSLDTQYVCCLLRKCTQQIRPKTLIHQDLRLGKILPTLKEITSQTD